MVAGAQAYLLDLQIVLQELIKDSDLKDVKGLEDFLVKLNMSCEQT